MMEDILIQTGQELDDPGRVAALDATGLLDSPPEEGFDVFTRLVCQTLGCRLSLISLVESHRQFFKSTCGLPSDQSDFRETPISHSFCQHVVKGGRALCITDARNDDRVMNNPAIKDYNVIAYLGVPILTEDRYVLGSLCAIEGKPREWTPEEINAMEVMAMALGNEIRLRAMTMRLREQVEQMEEIEKQRDEMLHILVHDLRNPISAVLGCLSLLKDSEDSTEVKEELFETAEQAGGATIALLNKILDKNGLESGHYRLDLKAISVGSLLRHVFQLSKPQADFCGHELSVIYPEKGSVVKADHGLLVRVLLNLLFNAIKYCPSGSKITLSAEPPVPGETPAYWRFSLADSGPGIKDAEKESIFGKGTKGSSALREGQTSFGLGLYFCRNVIEAHGGTIHVEDTLGGGSTFIFTLPVCGD